MTITGSSRVGDHVGSPLHCFLLHGRSLPPSCWLLVPGPSFSSSIQRFVRRLLRRHAGGHIGCVSHGDPIQIARAGFAGRPLAIASLRNQPDYPAKGSITRLRFHGLNDARPDLDYIVPSGQVGKP